MHFQLTKVLLNGLKMILFSLRTSGDPQRTVSARRPARFISTAFMPRPAKFMNARTFDCASSAPRWAERETKAPSFCPDDAPPTLPRTRECRLHLNPPPVFTVLLLIALKQRHSRRLVPGNWLHLEAVAARARFTRGPRAAPRRRRGRNQSSFRRSR